MIKRLAPGIATKIAAGEVIERPSSVAKELIENSLDAGAKNISLYTEQGGKSSFVIEDDGCGIAFAELPLAVERYATSKISEADDLENILTLGYRGEALASVAAVSRMEIRSRAAGESGGGLIRCEGGRVTLHTETPAKPGTRIQVDDLFFNLPARRKFLKSSSAELRRVIQIVNDYALIHPEVSFLIREGEKKVLEYRVVSSVDERMELRWGKQTGIFFAGLTEGALSARLWWNPVPDSRRVAVTLFVNGRRVQDAVVRAAVMSAEGAAYGEWAVVLDLPPRDVDVNIHPAKEEIRFRRSGEVFRIVSDCSKAVYAKRRSAGGGPLSLPAAEARQEGGKEFCPRSGVARAGEPWSFVSKRAEPSFPARVSSPAAGVFSPADEEESRVPADFPKRYIGQSAGGFLLFDFPGALAIMDPHAAHERILFEEICESFKDKIAVQRLAFPMEIPEAARHAAALYAKELAALGFETADGAVVAVPAIRGRGHLSPVDMLRSALRGIETERDESKRDREVWWRMARLACRDAVKLGKRFEPEEALSLLSRLEECDRPYICPHGRPTVFIIENKKLRDLFDR